MFLKRPLRSKIQIRRDLNRTIYRSLTCRWESSTRRLTSVRLSLSSEKLEEAYGIHENFYILKIRFSGTWIIKQLRIIHRRWKMWPYHLSTRSKNQNHLLNGHYLSIDLGIHNLTCYDSEKWKDLFWEGNIFTGKILSQRNQQSSINMVCTTVGKWHKISPDNQKHIKRIYRKSRTQKDYLW